MNKNDTIRLRRLLGFSALLVGVTCSIALMAAPARASTGVGDIFPSLALAGTSGSQPPETAGRVVVVDFWASWCAPCRASFPAFERLNSEFGQKGLVIVSVSVDQDEEAYRSFTKRFKPGFYVALDSGQSLVRAAAVPTMPTSYVLDRNGRVRYMHAGFHGDTTEQALHAEVIKLLSEK